MTTATARRETLAASLVRRWAALYTLGAPEAGRDRRRMEVESDVWEHEQDRLAAGVASSLIALEVLGRMVRGMPADLFWRLKLEGPTVQLNIPFERVAGVALLALLVLIPIAVGIDGYDTSREGWDGELTRLGELSDTATSGNLIFHAVSGVGLLVTATAFYLALRERATILATFAALAMAGAGILTLAASAAYQGLTSLANQYVDGGGSDGILETSRALAIVMAALGGSAGILLACSVYALAFAAHRLRIVPRWLIAIPAVSIAIFPPAMVIDAATSNDWTWYIFMGALALLLLWLIVAGITLLFGRRVASPLAGLPSPAAP